jgi:hypothetical protein
MQSWHFTLEHEVMRDTALRLSYIGNHGRNLEQKFGLNGRGSEWNYQARTGLRRPGTRDLMRVNRDWNLQPTNHTGFSNSQSFQAEIERRYSNGLAFQWFYTFNHTLTTTDAGGFTSGGGSINATGGGNFGVPENIDLFGEPSLSYDDRLRLGYYNTANIPAHRVRWNGIYDLPFGKGQRFLVERQQQPVSVRRSHSQRERASRYYLWRTDPGGLLRGRLQFGQPRRWRRCRRLAAGH